MPANNLPDRLIKMHITSELGSIETSLAPWYYRRHGSTTKIAVSSTLQDGTNLIYILHYFCLQLSI